ncbi:MAG: hypothetical protein CMJ19_14580 [Phycisphaeraceae bacterium]|nr:hypothetical protein [Phycisphaeraceae bacterium]
MRLRNSCVNGLALPITRLMLVLGVQFCLIGQLSAQSLIPQQAQMHPDLADSQMHLVNAMDSTRGMFGGSWKMSKVGLSTDIKPQAKLGGAVVKMTARAWSSGAKGDVHVAGGLPGEPTHLGVWVYVDQTSNVGSVGFQIYDGEGEALMYKTELEGFVGGWKFIEAQLNGKNYRPAWKQKDKNGKFDYPVKSVNIFWFTKDEGHTELITDALISLDKPQTGGMLSVEATMPANIEPDVNATSQLIVTNPTASDGKVNVQWTIQRNGDYQQPVLPDSKHGSNIAQGCESWTLFDGKRIKENTLTDTAMNSHASTDYDKAGKITEAFQIIDLGRTQNISHIRITNSDAKWTWHMSFSGSMDGKTWTDFAGMSPVDMYRKWGTHDVAVPTPQKLRYFRIRHHKNGEGVQKIAMPNTVALFNGTEDESWQFPNVGNEVASGQFSESVAAHSFAALSCDAKKTLKPGSYQFFAGLTLDGKTSMTQQQFFVMPHRIADDQLEDRLGINTANIAYLELNRRMGVKWVRFENLKWRLMSKAPKQVVFDGLDPWNVNHDEYFSTSKSLGLNGLGYLFMSPRYTSSCPPELNFKHDAAYPPKAPEDYYFYVNQVVSRYGKQTHSPSGLVSEDKKSGLDLVQAYEIWNEPNLNAPDWGHWIGTLPEYYEFMRPAVEAGHQADPKALMFNGGFAGIELGLINTMATYTYDDGKHPCDIVDGLSVHTYTGAIAPELSRVDTNLHRGSNAVSGTPHLENLMRLVDWRDTHMKGKPLWMTETGYDTGGTRAVPMRKHAAYTVRNIMMMLGAGINNVMIYREAGDGNSLYAASGMLTSQGQPRAAYFTLATLARQISGSGPIHKLQFDNPDIWAYAWIKDGKPAMAIWSVTNEGTLDWELGSAKMTDAFGYDESVSKTRGMKLTELPMYLSDVEHADVLLKAIDKSKQWYADWTKARHSKSVLKTYLFDMGDDTYVESFDLGAPRPYTPVGFDAVYSEQKGYGFTSPGVKNGDVHWIANKASRDGVMLEKDPPAFKFKAQPGKYRLDLRCVPRGGADADVVISGLDGGEVTLKVNRKTPEASADVVVGNQPITVQTRNWVMLNYVRLVEVE